MREILHQGERASDLWPDCAAFLIASWFGLQHAAKVVLVEVEIEVEAISITTFLSYCSRSGEENT